MNNLKLVYFLTVASLLLLIINIYRLDFNNLKNGNYFGIISNVLLLILFIIKIRELKKNLKNNEKH